MNGPNTFMVNLDILQNGSMSNNNTKPNLQVDEWAPWFAWRPVFISTVTSPNHTVRIAWLRRIMRRHIVWNGVKYKQYAMTDDIDHALLYFRLAANFVNKR